MWWAWMKLDLHGWVWLALGWIAMALVLTVALGGTSRLLTGPDGDAAELLGTLRKKYAKLIAG